MAPHDGPVHVNSYAIPSGGVMDHTKEIAQVFGLLDVAFDVGSSVTLHSSEIIDIRNALFSLRSALSEKTAQVEEKDDEIKMLKEIELELLGDIDRLREAIAKASSSMKGFSCGWRDDSVAAQWSRSVANDMDEAIAETAPSKSPVDTFARFEKRGPGMTDVIDGGVD